jgi:hypothetical protein
MIVNKELPPFKYKDPQDPVIAASKLPETDRLKPWSKSLFPGISVHQLLIFHKKKAGWRRHGSRLAAFYS